MAAAGRHSADGVLVAALASGATYAEAAKLAGVSERTARRRMEEREFRREVELARKDLVDRAVGRCADSLVEAVDVTRELMGSSDSDATRLSAARTLLAYVGRRRFDPVAEAVNGATSISVDELQTWVREIVQLALVRFDADSGQLFVADLEALFARRMRV